MKNLFLFLFAALLIVSCRERVIIPPHSSINYYARQNGLTSMDTTSFWAYQSVTYFSQDDSTRYMETHTVVDTSIINGLPAYDISVTTSFTSSTYSMRSDSTGLYTECQGYVNYLKYPTLVGDTFAIINKNGCLIYATTVSTDTTINYNGYEYANCIAYHTWFQNGCVTMSDTYSFYQYNLGLVAQHVNGQNSITRKYLIASH